MVGMIKVSSCEGQSREIHLASGGVRWGGGCHPVDSSL